MAWVNEPDYTGASAQEYINRYTNRPEDAGSLEGIQNILSNIGMAPGIGEPADFLNMLLYVAVVPVRAQTACIPSLRELILLNMVMRLVLMTVSLKGN